MQTDVYGSRAYHARCLEPGCDWESRRYDRIQQAQAAAKKHAAQHFAARPDVAEVIDPNNPWGPQGNFAGATPVDVGGVSMKNIEVGDTVKYFGQTAKILAMSNNRKYSRINIPSDFGGTTKDVLTSDLKLLGQGMAENFADGRNPGRKGLAKRMGVNCKQPVSKLRSIAKNSSGERQRMAHWCANITENLRQWFKQKWVRFGPDGKIRGDCARGSEKEGKPKCLPQAKAHALGKKGRASAAARKRRQDPNPNRRGKAINVATKKK
jgi:hypothetical protein